MTLPPTLPSPLVQLWTGTDARDVFLGDDRRDFMSGGGGDDHLEGRGGNDKLNGEAGHDHLFGGTGNDSLSGGAQNDSLKGGIGADTMDGGDGFDTVSYAFEPNGVTVNLATGVASGGTAAGDALSNIEGVKGSNGSDTLTGNRGDNVLAGNDGDDRIIGAGGNDVIEGGRGDDVMTGSGVFGASRESNTFVFAPNAQLDGGPDPSLGHDRITDFNSTSDRMDVSGLLGIDSFSDVNVAQIGGDTLVSFDGIPGDVLLQNVSASSIGTSDFIF